MKITKIKLLNSSVYHPEIVLDMRMVEQHLIDMCSQGIWPHIIILEVKLNEDE